MGGYIKEYERYIIETMLKDGRKPKEIAVRIGKHYTTVYREIKRGTVSLRDGHTWQDKEVYCADVAQRKQRENGHNKGISIKLGNDYSFIRETEYLIKEKGYSPYAALIQLQKEKKLTTSVCTSTLYSYIHAGLFLNVTEKDLPYNQKQKQKNPEKRHCYHKADAKKIEARPKEANSRLEYGHWEMDTVYGGKGTSKSCLLVLTERKFREELVFPIPDRTAASVVHQIDLLEKEMGTRKFRSKFKTITCDNGVEFSDHEGMERSINMGIPRFSVYFCHPFCSAERGSNENANKLIRRHIPKGADIGRYSPEKVAYIQDWINNYPRKMYGGLSVLEYKAASGIP